MGYFFQGLTMGLAYVAPIGLQNLFVINSALTNTRRRALLTAWIVIFFDVTLAFACFFGIGAVMERYQWLQMAILCVGSLIVICIGISCDPACPTVHPVYFRRGNCILSLVHGHHPCYFFVQ